MRESRRRIDPVELEKARLRLLHHELLQLLKSKTSQTLDNSQTGRFFYEKFHINKKLGFIISSPVHDSNSNPTTESTFVVVLEDAIPQPTLVIVPAECYQTFEIAADPLRQQNPLNNATYLPSHPEAIKRIIERKNLKTQSISSANLGRILRYLLSLKKPTP